MSDVKCTDLGRDVWHARAPARGGVTQDPRVSRGLHLDRTRRNGCACWQNCAIKAFSGDELQARRAELLRGICLSRVAELSQRWSNGPEAGTYGLDATGASAATIRKRESGRSGLFPWAGSLLARHGSPGR